VSSIPDDVTGIFYSHNPELTPKILESTQPLTEIISRNISCGVRAAGVDFHEIWEPQTPGTLRVSLGLYRDSFTFIWGLSHQEI